jgi:hypothetical protein
VLAYCEVVNEIAADPDRPDGLTHMTLDELGKAPTPGWPVH